MSIAAVVGFDPTRDNIGVPQTVMLPIEIWTQIVFASLKSDDYRLRTLIEQAVAAASISSMKGAS